jgi:hypothetical protein
MLPCRETAVSTPPVPHLLGAFVKLRQVLTTPQAWL